KFAGNAQKLQHSQCDPMLNVFYWIFNRDSENWYKIKGLDTTQIWDTHLSKADDGMFILLWDWNGGDNQKWYIDYINESQFLIRAKHSNKCLSQTSDNSDIV